MCSDDDSHWFLTHYYDYEMRQCVPASAYRQLINLSVQLIHPHCDLVSMAQRLWPLRILLWFLNCLLFLMLLTVSFISFHSIKRFFDLENRPVQWTSIAMLLGAVVGSADMYLVKFVLLRQWLEDHHELAYGRRHVPTLFV